MTKNIYRLPVFLTHPLTTKKGYVLFEHTLIILKNEL